MDHYWSMDLIFFQCSCRILLFWLLWKSTHSFYGNTEERTYLHFEMWQANGSLPQHWLSSIKLYFLRCQSMAVQYDSAGSIFLSWSNDASSRQLVGPWRTSARSWRNYAHLRNSRIKPNQGLFCSLGLMQEANGTISERRRGVIPQRIYLAPRQNIKLLSLWYLRPPSVSSRNGAIFFHPLCFLHLIN